MSTLSVTQQLFNYNRAAYPFLWVLTHEYIRFTQELLQAFPASERQVFAWDHTDGLKTLVRGGAVPNQAEGTTGDTWEVHPKAKDIKNSTMLFQWIRQSLPPRSVIILRDLQGYMMDIGLSSLILHTCAQLSSVGSSIIAVSGQVKLPPELAKSVHILDFDYPTPALYTKLLEVVHQGANQNRKQKNQPLFPALDPTLKEEVAESCRGMTSTEALNAMSYAIVSEGVFDNRFVRATFAEKIIQLRKNGVLTYIPVDMGFDAVGGSEGLKTWILARKCAYSQAARDYSLPLPKGLLLASVPGTGKTAMAKAIAYEFNAPLFIFDLGALFGGHVGDTERNLRDAIRLIEAMGRCVLLLDEVEKFLNEDAVSGKGDSGVSSRLFGTLLTWLQDRKNPAFIVATSNDYTKLPSALIRKGRFDELFWVDLPDEEERLEIWNVILKRYNRDPKNFKVQQLVDQSKDFTGAEIEQTFTNALFNAFQQDGTEVTTSHVLSAARQTIPFAESHKEALALMREQVYGKLVRVSRDGQIDAGVQAVIRESRSVDVEADV